MTSKLTDALRQRSVATLQTRAGSSVRVSYVPPDPSVAGHRHGFLVQSRDGFDLFGPARFTSVSVWLDGYAAATLDALPTRTVTAPPGHECAWKDAIIDAAVVEWTFTAEHAHHPRAVVRALLAQAQRAALDPLVSPEAARLHEEISHLSRIAADLREQLAARDSGV